MRSAHGKPGRHTDIEQASAIILLVDNVVVEDLVVQGPRFRLCGRHIVCMKYVINKARKAFIERGMGKVEGQDLYFAARAMSLGSYSRGNADFGRSALNNLALIGCGGETREGRYRVG